VTLPVHGFVLAGGKSSRMGVDKALLPFRGRAMVEIALGKLREFCADVSIVGNREDLSGFAEVVGEARVNVGAAAGIEAGLAAARQEWVMFLPVDAPLVPVVLLRRWAEECLAKDATGLRASYLMVGWDEHPVMCCLRKDCLPVMRAELDHGQKRVGAILAATHAMGWAAFEKLDARRFVPEAGEAEFARWFANVNTPGELAEAEAAAGQDADPLRG
jgi:molybdopterin-guanine dinucleotide biosynthesis protein A